MYKVLIGLTILIIITACNKDKYNTKPKLTFNTVNQNTFARGNKISFNLTCTDAEGDVSDSIFMYKINRNCGRDTLRLFYTIPKYPLSKNLSIDLNIDYNYAIPTIPTIPTLTISNTCNNRNDSCRFKFIVKDKAGNRRDSVLSSEIVLLR